MALYQYRCKECGNLFEELRSYSECDDPISCPSCGKDGKRMIAEPGAVIYNGSGYYCKDSKSCCSRGCSKGDM